MLVLLKQFFIYGFASVIPKLVAIFMMPILTNNLTKTEYGVYALLLTCKGIMESLSNLNIHSGIARDYHDVKDRKVLISTGLYSILSCSVIMVLFLYITKFFWINSVLEISEFNSAFLLLIISIPFSNVLLYFSIINRLNNKPLRYTIAIVFQLVTQVGTSLFMLFILNLGVNSMLLGLLIGEIVAMTYYLVKEFSNIRFVFKYEYFKRALLFAIPTIPAMAAAWVDKSLGQVLINKELSTEVLAVYSVALSFASVFTLISTAFHNAWTPYLYENFKKENFPNEIQKIFKFMIICLIIVTINISFLSKDIIILLSNIGYIEAYKYLILLCFPMSLSIIMPIVNSGANLTRKTKHLSYSYFIGMFINLVLLFSLIPSLGVICVPIAMGVSKLISFLYLRKYCSKHVNYNLSIKYILLLFTTVFLCYYLINLDYNRFLYYLILIIINSIFVIFFIKNNKYIWKRKRSLM